MTNYEEKSRLAKTIFLKKAKAGTNLSAVDACIVWMLKIGWMGVKLRIICNLPGNQQGSVVFDSPAYRPMSLWGYA